jgi:MATE family multidrug resistance protein
MYSIKALKNRWQTESGYGEVLQIAFPLILSTGAWSIQHFIDRMFLTWYSEEAIAASMPAGMVNWTLISLLIGTAVYTNTFVAQYFGAKQFDRIGPAVWQGIYLALFSAPVILIFYPLSDALFDLVGHDPKVRDLESVYFKILLLGSPFVVAANAMSGFFSGRGKTWVVMWVNTIGMMVNLILDYFLIFGNAGFPEMGMRGAAWATVFAATVTAALFFIWMIRPKMKAQFATLSGWRFNVELFRRLLRYGLPNGLQFLLELLAFTIFIMLVGKIGVKELAASNIAFNINMLAFLPMYGMSLAVSTLVGQRLGENRPPLAEKSTWSAFHMAFAYFGILALGYFFLPGIFMWPFASKSNAADFKLTADLTVVLLKFVAVYSLFDAANMVFSGALKGAGDTGYVAKASIGFSWICMLVPSFVGLYFFNAGLNWLWFFVTLYVAALGVVFYLRFKKGIWQSMRVIESTENPEGKINKKA